MPKPLSSGDRTRGLRLWVAVLWLQRRLDLSDPNGWQDIFTNATAMTGDFVDGPPTNGASFYRIRVSR